MWPVRDAAQTNHREDDSQAASHRGGLNTEPG